LTAEPIVSASLSMSAENSVAAAIRKARRFITRSIATVSPSRSASAVRRAASIMVVA
jgi:hypothetical protein